MEYCICYNVRTLSSIGGSPCRTRALLALVWPCLIALIASLTVPSHLVRAQSSKNKPSFWKLLSRSVFPMLEHTSLSFNHIYLYDYGRVFLKTGKFLKFSQTACVKIFIKLFWIFPKNRHNCTLTMLLCKGAPSRNNVLEFVCEAHSRSIQDFFRHKVWGIIATQGEFRFAHHLNYFLLVFFLFLQYLRQKLTRLLNHPVDQTKSKYWTTATLRWSTLLLKILMYFRFTTWVALSFQYTMMPNKVTLKEK